MRSWQESPRNRVKVKVEGAGEEAARMSSGTFVDRIDPFAKRSLKKKSKKSQGSSRYRNSQDVELQQLPALKGE